LSLFQLRLLLVGNNWIC